VLEGKTGPKQGRGQILSRINFQGCGDQQKKKIKKGEGAGGEGKGSAGNSGGTSLSFRTIRSRTRLVDDDKFESRKVRLLRGKRRGKYITGGKKPTSIRR